MSRTKKGRKGPGYEYWGKRRGGGFSPSKGVKQMIHQMERSDGKLEVRQGIQELREEFEKPGSGVITMKNGSVIVFREDDESDPEDKLRGLK